MNKHLLFLLLCGFLSTTAPAVAAEYNAVVPDGSTSALYTKLVQAVLQATGNTAHVQILPTDRCIRLLETRQVDLLAAGLGIPDSRNWGRLKYDFSTAGVMDVVIVLYTNRNKPIDMELLKKGNKVGYRIETDFSHIDHFLFPISGSKSIEASLRKVDEGLIDGFLFTQPAVDGVLRDLDLKNVSRSYYGTFTETFLLRKGGRNGALDRLLTDGMNRIRSSGTYELLLRDILPAYTVYDDWQP